MNIGLTGGIASGKSTASRMLVKRGAILIDADQIAREVVLPGTPALQQIAKRFGQAILQNDGSLDRKRLGGIIFSDKSAKGELEAILHPRIRTLMQERKAKAEADHPHTLVILDIPLLFESGLQYMVDEIVLIYVRRDIQLARLMERDGLSEEQAELRLLAQMPMEDKKKLADTVIDNSLGLEHLEQQIEQFWSRKGLS